MVPRPATNTYVDDLQHSGERIYRGEAIKTDCDMKSAHEEANP